MATDHSLTELFQGRVFEIPDYQRGYAWEEEHVGDLWEDLSVMPPSGRHYTGTVVLCNQGHDNRIEDDKGRLYQVSDVVDGQQRLTTVTLLLNELRRRLQALNEDEKATGIAEQYIWRTIGGKRQPKLTLGEDLQEFWRDAVLRDESLIHVSVDRQSARRLKAARELLEAKFDELLAGLNEADAQSELQLVRIKVTDRLRFTTYEVDDDAQVGVIFETLNDRGKPLTELEKVKNYLLFLAAGLDDAQRRALVETVKEKWSSIYRLLMKAGVTDPRDENRFLRAHWLMAYDPIRRHWDGATSLKQKFSRPRVWRYDGPPEEREEILRELVRYVETLADSAQAFCDIYRPLTDYAYGDFPDRTRAEVRSWGDKFRRLGKLASFAPLLMAVRLRFTANAGLYLRVLKLSERFAFRVYSVRGSRADKGQARLFRLANDVFLGKADEDEVVSRLRDAVAKWCNGKRFRRDLTLEGDEQNWYTWGSIRYFLYEYEEFLTSERRTNPKLEWPQVAERDLEETIEHILPQNPREGEWPEFDEEERRKLTHDLGNVVLTFDNSHYSNKSFEEKRGESGPVTSQEAPASYSRSPILQERDLSDYAEWTPATVRDRKQELIHWALNRWSVEGDSPLSPEDDVQDEDLIEAQEEDVEVE